MAKTKKTVSLTPEQLDKITLRTRLLKELNSDLRTFDITEALIKDDFCNYLYKVIRGTGIGDRHKVDGSGIIEDDLRKAFQKFSVHLAVIDGVFRHSKIEIDDIDKFHKHDLTELFSVTGFKMSGSIDNESILLIGNKYVQDAGGRMEIKTEKIPLNKLSIYKWHNELLAAADEARQEVALYREGYYTAVEEEDEKEDPAQTDLFKQPTDNGNQQKDESFENGKIQ